MKTALAALAFLMGTLPVPACTLALSLALDVSSSVDDREFTQQATGLASALTHPEVQDAIFALPDATIALHIYQWSGRRNQLVVLDWTPITAPDDLTRVAELLRSMPRATKEFPTSLGHALGFGAIALRDAPDCARKTLDVSGDGRNNEGFAPEHAYRAFPFAGITVNGLAIGGADPLITAYYRTEVISGPGAFVEEARDYADYARAMRRKLVREIGIMAVSKVNAPRG